MPAMPVGPGRIIDITDVSGSQGVHCTMDMRCRLCRPGETALRTLQKSQRSRQAVGYCTIDIVDVFGEHRGSRKHLGKPRDTVRLISWMCSVVCPVRLDEVNGIEHVVFDVFWGEQSHVVFDTETEIETDRDRPRQTETDRDRPDPDRPRQI